ncbi:GFA family protein [Neptunicella marina]|uniref:GFA family protein n=1 Tax=Neptunicella marina TaxID=2125989 RepID=A0A8J6IXF3_9ALTE|nr:GFA family protein [Neptunicella marina]MBC3767088.1 GFA family protein [Neptunicella marina]
MQKYHGSCLCQSVKYCVTGKFEQFYLCHCQYCQKDTGSAHAANLFSSSARLEWLEGKDKVTQFHLPASRHARAFCQQCGSALPFENHDLSLLVVPAGSLDQPVDIKPTAHLFTQSQAGWEQNLAATERFKTFPHLK